MISTSAYIIFNNGRIKVWLNETGDGMKLRKRKKGKYGMRLEDLKLNLRQVRILLAGEEITLKGE